MYLNIKFMHNYVKIIRKLRFKKYIYWNKLCTLEWLYGYV